jgi:acyl-CoA synthetase (AMP-forming)/AMP-acid ligase II
MLADNKTPQSRFSGYYNQPKATNAKLIQNVFVEGDQYMRSGDYLYRSKDNFWYFADRAGDTYRWKGENVSTAEIADLIGHVDGVDSCTVYGVKVPGQDGRAGMAAIVLADKYWGEANTAHQESKSGEVVDSYERKVNETLLQEFMDRLGKFVIKRFPVYAIPRFVRIREGELEITGTFKNKKVELKKEGFDLDKISERLYWWSAAEGRYLPFGTKENELIVAGRARL